MFLGIGASVSNWNAAGTDCSLTLDENPLADFAEVPEQFRCRALNIPEPQEKSPSLVGEGKCETTGHVESGACAAARERRCSPNSIPVLLCPLRRAESGAVSV